MGDLFLTSTGGLALSSGGLPSLAAGISEDFLTSAPTKPSATVTMTWEAAGDPVVAPVTETTNCWSDDGGTTLFNSLELARAAQTVPTTFNMPAGDFILTTEVKVNGLNSGAFVGALSGSDPNTAFQQQSAGADCFILDSTNYGNTHLWLENIKIGAFDADIAAFNFVANISNISDYNQIQEGDDGVVLIRGGNVWMTNCTVQFVNSNGFSAVADFEWFEDASVQVGTREISQVGIYESEFFGNGNNSGEHQIYIHGAPTYIYKTVIRDNVSGGHCLKYDGEMVLLNQVHIDNDTTTDFNRPNFSISTPVDITMSGDFAPIDTFIRGLVGSGTNPAVNRNLINIAARANAQGSGFSKRVPPNWEQDLTGGRTNNTPNSRALQWKTGSLADPDDTYGGEISSYNSSIPAIVFKSNATPIGQSLGTVSNNTSSLFWTVAWQGETKTATKASSATADTTITSNAVTNDTVIAIGSNAGLSVSDTVVIQLNSGFHYTTVAVLSPFEITDALPSNADANNTVFKASVYDLSSSFTGVPVGGDWSTLFGTVNGPDTPFLNQDWWDSAIGTNYMDSIKSGSAVDKTKFAKVALQTMQNCMTIIDDSQQSIGNGRLWHFFTTPPLLYANRGQTVAQIPATPIAGENSTTSWNRAGDGALLFDASGTIYLGNEPTTDNFVLPMIASISGTSVVVENGSTTSTSNLIDFIVDFGDNQQGTNYPYTPLVTKIENSVDTTITDPTSVGGVWAPTVVSTTTTQAEVAAATTIQVASITGISSGDLIKIAYPMLRGGFAVHTTTVNGAPSGTTVTLTDALEAAIDSGARVHVQTIVGTLPAYVLDHPTMWNSRRVA